MDLRRETVGALAARVRSRELSARELVAHALVEIERQNGAVNAFCAVDGERALEAAGALDERIAAGGDPGPLAGIPIGVKDLEDAAGFVTTYGSDLHLTDPPAAQDSVLVSRLKAAGAIVVGKTNTPEFGFTAATENVPFGATANPWDLAHSPGGSSGGSAAAIAAGMVPLATGSDGGGSIRIPSSLCGQSGIKCSQGRVPLGGAAPPGAGILSVKGPMARRIRDVALALDASVGPDPTDIFAFPGPHEPWHPQLAQVRPPERVVYSPTMGFADVDAEVAAAVEAAVRALEAAGTVVTEVPAVFSEDPVGHWVNIWTVQRFRAQGALRDTPAWERITPELRAQIEFGAHVSAADYSRAIDACHLLNLQLEKALAGASLILCPTVAGQVPLSGRQGTVNGVESVGWVAFTPFVNMTRNPAGTVCCGFTSKGLPVGLQVIGRQRDDLGVLRAVAVIEDLMAIETVAGTE